MAEPPLSRTAPRRLGSGFGSSREKGAACRLSRRSSASKAAILAWAFSNWAWSDSNSARSRWQFGQVGFVVMALYIAHPETLNKYGTRFKERAILYRY